MISSKQIEYRRIAAIPRGVGVMCDFYAEKAENATITTIEGKQYIDFAGGIGVLNTGHLHPKVKAAVAAQLEKFSHTCYQVVPYELYITVAEKINIRAPVSGEAKTCFFTTGAEAVENAVKIAKAYTKKRAVIAFQGAFHGRTNLTLALTGKVTPYKIDFGPFVGDIYHATYPNALHGVTVKDALDSLQKLFKVDVSVNDVAAIIIEPIQGEGGFNVAPNEFLQALRQLCDQHGIVLIFDEVQSGFARTGKLFATQHSEVKPDLITMAKSLAGGFPLSGVVGKREIMDAPILGGLGGTYAGNPLALAAADAVIDCIEQEKICERALLLGERLRQHLLEWAEKIPQIRMVRGLGSMVAVEFMRPDSDEPDAVFTKAVQQYALRNGLLLLSCGMHYNVLRFLYPITIDDRTFEQALVILQQALDYAAQIE